jgi:hypothetical protein
MPGGARFDRKVKKKLGTPFFLPLSIYIVCTHMRLQNRATGTANARMPACHLGTMEPSVATLARRQSPPPQAALPVVGHWPNLSNSRLGLVGQSVCGIITKLITGRYRPVPGTGTGTGRFDPVDPVTWWDNLEC